ncbi:MAG: hypothetical protein H7A21_14050 [Spirochaetales bacterium]|nr:hypothetical protein [Leptospiraceae bacterium]MCP5482555.1 hypothetical protein [Spirochaetales bacterium]MCP5485145.1 hypothetical protein [Spirochaetales bacterium]
MVVLILYILGLLCLVAALIGGVMILIAAFQEDTTQGILCLLIPAYIWYYAIARLRGEKRNLILALYFGGLILAMGLFVIAANTNPGA